LSASTVRIACFSFCAATRQDGKIDALSLNAALGAGLYRAVCGFNMKFSRRKLIAESSFSGLPKCVCKRAGITHDVRYRNAFLRGTIYADLSGIRN
jgi:hypothetical protein